MARHTSQLQRMPRKNNSDTGAAIFLAEATNNRCSGAAVLNRPLPTISRLSRIAPSKLPRKTSPQFFSVSLTVVRPASVLMVKNMLLPVNSSDPAKMTSVRASPKDMPINMVCSGDCAARSGAPILKIRTMPSPT
ncbi:hypothetical protein D3C74_378790 [compost metagenome]